MSSQPPARRRNPALVTVDIIAGILLLLFGAVLALVVFTTALDYGNLHVRSGCGQQAYEGITCSPVALGIVVYGLIVVAVLALFLGFGMFVVSLIRKRWVFYWPLGAIVLTLGLFYPGSWIAGLTLP